MKSVKYKSKGNSELPFPKLMIGRVTGNICLFKDKDCGTYVYVTEPCSSRLGEHCGNSDGFRDYDGSVCLSNS